MDNKVTIYGKSGGVLLKIDVNDNSYRYRAIMSTHTVTLYYSLSEHVEIPVGSYIIYQAVRYTLWAPENFKKNSKRNFEYTVEFGDNTELLKLYKYKDLSEIPYRVKFPLTAKPKTFLKLLVDNMNLRDSGWSVGACIDAVEKALSFNHEYCYDVLCRFASEWGTEWEVEDKTINLCRVEKFKSSPLPLSYGKGNGIKPGTGRANQGDKKPVSLLYVQGGERNIDYSKYKSKSLLLPISQELEYEGRRYVTDAHGMYIVRVGSTSDIIREDSFDASDIYPKRVGSVTAVEVINTEKNFYDFIDSSIPDELNFNDYLIAGETMTVIFQSGMLAGDNKEFEVKYFHDPILNDEGEIEKEGRRFEIVPQEIDGMMMPNAVYCPKSTDTYAVFNVSLPDAYICNNSDKTGASWDMFRDAVRYLYEHEEVEFSFSGTLDGIWSKKKWLEIGGRILPGAYTRFSDTQFQPDGIDIRITGVKDYINKPYSPEIELSNTPVAGYVTSDLGKIDANEVINEGNYKGSLQFTKRRWRDAMETFGMLENAFLNFSNSIDPIAVRTMQLLVGDESLQFRFVTSKTNPIVISYNITYDIKKKILKAPATILQHMTMGIDTITASHKVGDYKFWDMAEYNSPPLVDAAKKYYMYAKVSKENSSGTFLLSETAIKIEGIAGYYHLLVGILNSEYEGERSFVELYGFTEILPGRITTDRIVSTDGKTYFDLVRSEIGGKIKFAYGSSGLENLEEWESVRQDIDAATQAAKDANNSVGGLHDYIDGAFADGIITEAEAKAIEKYINSVNSTKSAVEATYNKLYVNTYLTGTAKTGLLNSKVTMMGSIEDLIRSINTAIADGQTTVAEKNDVDAKYALFNSAYADFNDAVETAYKAIQNKLKEYSDDAKDYAGQITATAKDSMAQGLGYADYKALSDAAKAGNTIITGGKINTELIEATAIITSQILANVINGNGLNIGGDKFVVYVDENKQVRVSIKGKVVADEGVFYGSIAVPPQEIPNNSTDLTLSFANGFNFAGQLSKGVKKIYLPTTSEYVGVQCSIVNYGGTSNGYYEIKTVSNTAFLYSGTPKNRNTINSIKLYGTSQLKLKAIKVGGVIRWFIENYTDFSFDYINSCLTNGIPNQMTRCLGSYWMASQNSLVVRACNDGNKVNFASYAADGRFTFAFTKSRTTNRDYTIIVRNESGNNCPYRITNKSNSGFTIEFNFQYAMGMEGIATIYVSSGNWGFDIFEFDT
jgi:hypothetical protein|nr:MAG TPA: Minor structural protein putative tail fiber [Caudoviricetes sp.]